MSTGRRAAAIRLPSAAGLQALHRRVAARQLRLGAGRDDDFPQLALAIGLVGGIHIVAQARALTILGGRRIRGDEVAAVPSGDHCGARRRRVFIERARLAAVNRDQPELAVAHEQDRLAVGRELDDRRRCRRT
jgi:hypothetical protein